MLFPLSQISSLNAKNTSVAFWNLLLENLHILLPSNSSGIHSAYYKAFAKVFMSVLLMNHDEARYGFIFKILFFFFLPISFQNSWVKMLNMVLLPILEKVWYNLQHFCKFYFSSKFLDLGTTCFILLGLVVCSTMFLLQVIFQGQDFALILELEIHCLNALPIIVRFCFGTWMHSMEILFYGKEYFDITVLY